MRLRTARVDDLFQMPPKVFEALKVALLIAAKPQRQRLDQSRGVPLRLHYTAQDEVLTPQATNCGHYAPDVKG